MSVNIAAAELQEALKQRQGMVQLQPIFSVDSGQPVFHEVLLRLLDARGEELLPKFFLPTAVTAGLLPEIDLLTLHLLEDQMHLHEKLPPTRVSVNVSRRTLTYQPYLEKLRQSSWSKLLPQLMFEVKSADIGQDVAALKSLKTLKDVGTCLCVDYQKGGAQVVKLASQLGFDYLKIDCVGVTLKYNEQALVDVMAACEAAHKAGLKVIFERVETHRDYTFIKKYKPEMVQGYLFAHPSLLFSRLKLDFGKY